MDKKEFDFLCGNVKFSRKKGKGFFRGEKIKFQYIENHFGIVFVYYEPVAVDSLWVQPRTPPGFISLSEIIIEENHEISSKAS